MPRTNLWMTRRRRKNLWTEDYILIEVTGEETRVLRTEEDVISYWKDAETPLVKPEDEGVEVIESAPTDSSTSSPVRVAESPGRGSASKRVNLKIVDKEYSKVDAVLEVRKVFGSPSNRMCLAEMLLQGRDLRLLCPSLPRRRLSSGMTLN